MDPQTRNKLSLVTTMKGPALSIFIVLALSGKPMLAQELETWTGYSHDAITKGLRTLTHLEAIITIGRRAGYKINPGWRQLELFTPANIVDNPSISVDKVVDNPPLNGNAVLIECGKTAVKNGLSAEKPQSTPDHDHDDHDDGKSLIRQLEQLRPPFNHARRFITQHPPTLIASWLDYLRDLDSVSKRKLKNQAAFIRARVQAGDPPPQRDISKLYLPT